MRAAAVATLAAALIVLGAGYAPRLAAQTAPGAGAAAPAADATAPAGSAAASDSASGGDDSMFGAETVTPSTPAPANSAPENSFLKYDQVKVGGQIKGNLGWNPTWSPAWDGWASLFSPTSDLITPDLEGRLTITAKPLTDFGVNAEFRTQWPFSTTAGYLTSPTTSGSSTVPNITVWSFYSKFNWQDRVYFSFGKQPLSWGVSKGAFQPADDIFALSSSIDLTDTSAEREGPVSLKMTVPTSNTDNIYFFAGIPTPSSWTTANGTATIDPRDARLGLKAELGTGNTELAAAAYYSYNDHPRALVMGTTGNGDFNFFGEAVLKYGSERDFITSYNDLAPLFSSIATYDSTLFFDGTAGGYYMNADSHITLLAQYYYNGEGQTKVSAQEAYTYYATNPGALDRIRIGTHYAFMSLSWGQFLQENLTATVYTLSNLTDGSGMVSPSLSWQMFDYMALSIGATFTFGPPGSEFIMYGPVVNAGTGSFASKPAAALNLSLTMSTESF